MRNYFYLFAFIFIFNSGISSAQVLCVQCYDQNVPVTDSINNLILNGSFENGCPIFGLFCPNSIYYSCNITDWNCTGGDDSTYARIYDTVLSLVPNGFKIAYFGNQFGTACSPVLFDISCIGTQGCTVTGIPSGYPLSNNGFGGNIGVSLEQTVSALTPGVAYVLEFWAGGEASGGWSGDGIFAVDVGFGNIFLSERPTPSNGGIGIRYIIEFIATSTAHTMKFTNWGHLCGGCTELVLDDVRLYELSELDKSVPHCDVGFNEDISNSSEIDIFPNPAQNNLQLFFKNSNQVRNLNFSILNLFNEAVLSAQLITPQQTIDVGSLTPGIYLIRIETEKGLIVKRWVKN